MNTDISEFKVNQLVISRSKLIYKVTQINFERQNKKIVPFESELLSIENGKTINATWYKNNCFEMYEVKT